MRRTLDQYALCAFSAFAKFATLAVVSFPIAASALDKPWDVESRVATAIGVVTSVWPHDERYKNFHKDLLEDYKGAPSWEDFIGQEQWVAVRTANSPLYRGLYSVRAKKEQGVAYGDIVEIKTSKYKTDKYEELGIVINVLCRKASPEYEDCRDRHQPTWFDAEGKRMEVPTARRPQQN